MKERSQGQVKKAESTKSGSRFWSAEAEREGGTEYVSRQEGPARRGQVSSLCLSSRLRTSDTQSRPQAKHSTASFLPHSFLDPTSYPAPWPFLCIQPSLSDEELSSPTFTTLSFLPVPSASLFSHKLGIPGIFWGCVWGRGICRDVRCQVKPHASAYGTRI